MTANKIVLLVDRWLQNGKMNPQKYNGKKFYQAIKICWKNFQKIRFPNLYKKDGGDDFKANFIVLSKLKKKNLKLEKYLVEKFK